MKKVFIGMSGGVDSTAAAIDVGTARELSNVAANFPVRRNFSAGGSSRKKQDCHPPAHKVLQPASRLRLTSRWTGARNPNGVSGSAARNNGTIQ